jgi:hypothetical protein
MGWEVNATPRPLYPCYPLHRRMGGPQGKSGQALKSSPPSGADHRTVKLVASHCNYYVIPARILLIAANFDVNDS